MKRFLTRVRSAWRMVGPGLLFGLLGGLLIVEFQLLRVVEKATTLDILNFAMLLALVVATLGYAISTNRIAKATEASVAEFEKQRILSTQPWVFPDLTQAGEYRSVSDPVPVKNIGKGPAIDLKVIISNEIDPVDKRRIKQICKDYKKGTLVWTNTSSGPSWPYLEPGDTELLKGAPQKALQGQKGIIAIEYKDIYAREILSGWAYRVEKGNGGRLVFIPGEPLYPVVREEM